MRKPDGQAKGFCLRGRSNLGEVILARRADAHLGEEEIERLLPPISEGAQEADPSKDIELELARLHLSQCEGCRNRLRTHETAESLLRGLNSGGGARGSDCPPDGDWPHIVTGMTSGSEAEKKLRHAAQCDYCGALLRQTLADFSIELTAEEKRVIAEMTSIKTGWQRKFAKRLSSMSRAKTSPISQKDRFGIRWWTMSATWRRWAIAGATAIVLFSISWMVLFRRPSVNAAAQVNELLAQAYGEKRITELRIQGAAYSSVWM